VGAECNFNDSTTEGHGQQFPEYRKEHILFSVESFPDVRCLHFMAQCAMLHFYMKNSMNRTSHIRRIAGVLLAVYSALLVLNAVHVHHHCVIPAMAELRALPVQQAHAHVHGAADCPLLLFFSNPFVTLSEYSPSDRNTAWSTVLTGANDAILPQLRYLHPALRAPPVA
jgi:hypothetical protein